MKKKSLVTFRGSVVWYPVGAGPQHSAGTQFSAVKNRFVTFRGSVVWYPLVRDPSIVR